MQMWFTRTVLTRSHWCNVNTVYRHTSYTAFDISSSSCHSFCVCIIYICTGLASSSSPLNSPNSVTACTYDENDRVPSGVIGRGIIDVCRMVYLCCSQSCHLDSCQWDCVRTRLMLMLMLLTEFMPLSPRTDNFSKVVLGQEFGWHIDNIHCCTVYW